MNRSQADLPGALRGWPWRLVSVFFNIMMYVLLNLGLWHKSVRPGLRHTARTRNVSYGPDRMHRLDVYRPRRADGPLAVVMYIHGGGFGTGSKRTHRIAAEKYAQLGYLVFNVDYRLAPRHPHPAGVQDVCRAYAWICEHAAGFGGDVSRLTVAGESAGGNLTATLLVACCWRRPEPWFRQVWNSGVVPKAFQVICAYLHVSEPQIRYAQLGKARRRLVRFVYRILNSFALAYLGKNAAAASQENLTVDIVRYLRQAPLPDRPIPAVFAPVGRRDLIRQDTYDVAEALRALGAEVDERHYAREPHAFQLLMTAPHTPQYWRDCADFMAEHVLGEGEAEASKVA